MATTTRSLRSANSCRGRRLPISACCCRLAFLFWLAPFVSYFLRIQRNRERCSRLVFSLCGRRVRFLHACVEQRLFRRAEPVDVEDVRATRMGVLMVPGAEEAIAAFAQKFPKVAASENPNYLGTPCGERELRTRFQAFGTMIGREEALPLVKEEPLLLAMEEENLRDSWTAMLRVAGGDREAALRVVRRRPGCLIAPASEFEGKTLKEFEAVSDAADTFKPVTDALRDIGPEGLAAGAAAFGVAALGALASKVVERSGKTSPRGVNEPPRRRPFSGTSVEDAAGRK